MKLKKIVLVRLEMPGETMFTPPFGLLLLADSLRKNGFKPVIFHEMATKKNFQKLYDLTKDNVLFVGFSTLTSNSLLYVIEAGKHIKSQGNIVLVGGVHATLLPEITIKEKFVDYVMRGESEESIVKFAKAINYKRKDFDFEGLCYKKGSEIVISDVILLIKDLDKYSFAWDLIDTKKYLFSYGKYNNLFPAITSRGCPYRCGFCYNLTVNKRLWRARNQDKVVDELKELKRKSDIKGIFFYDDYFFRNKKRAFEIVNSLNLPYTATIRADLFDEDFTKKLKETNCIAAYVGAESGSDKVLNLIDKDVSVSEIIKTAELCKKHKVNLYMAFMVMLPGETDDDREQTIKLIHKLMIKYHVVIDGPKVFNPYPGTTLYNKAKAHGWKEPNSLKEWASYCRQLNASKLGYINEESIRKSKNFSAIIGVTNFLVQKTRKGTVYERLFFNLFKPIELLERFRLKFMIDFFLIEIHIIKYLYIKLEQC